MDVLFQAPPIEAGTEHSIFTIVAMPTQLNGTPESKSKIMAYVVIRGDEVPGSADYPFGELLEGLDVNPYAVPVTNEELEVSTADERVARGIEDGTFYRTRVVRYAGWGAASFPIVEANADYVSAHPEKEKLSFYSPPPVGSTDYRMPASSEDKDGVAVTQIERFPSGPLPAVMLPQSTRTMNIDGAKFFPTSESTPRMLLNTSEEWAVYNQSIDTYSVATPDGSWTADQVNEYVGNNPELLYYQFRYVDDAPDGAPHSPQPLLQQSSL